MVLGLPGKRAAGRGRAQWCQVPSWDATNPPITDLGVTRSTPGDPVKDKIAVYACSGPWWDDEVPRVCGR
ncbi:hypothetical protein Pen01_70920 [Phytomonospora endophytica]|nr:hypothetical protein Pen01_70920 [Phytomonospora endophytica]